LSARRRKDSGTIETPVGKSAFDRYVLAFDVAEIAQRIGNGVK
jgi:hypothetical protein